MLRVLYKVPLETQKKNKPEVYVILSVFEKRCEANYIWLNWKKDYTKQLHRDPATQSGVFNYVGYVCYENHRAKEKWWMKYWTTINRKKKGT